MPYLSNEGLPPAVRNHLPPHAQDIFREAFNHAWEHTPILKNANLAVRKKTPPPCRLGGGEKAISQSRK